MIYLKIQTILSQIFSTPFHTIVRKVFILIRRFLFAWVNCIWHLIRDTQITDADFLQSLGNQFPNLASFNSHLTQRKESKFFIDPPFSSNVLAGLSMLNPQIENLTILAANTVSKNIFDLLGSGSTPLGEDIDWHVDFKTDHRWKLSFHQLIRPAAFPGGYDIKIPWELSRCQHFVWLGQAYLFTQDEKYAETFQRQLMHWVDKNPPKYGVNWACTMDVAIRVVNWIWGYHLFKNSSTLSPDFYLAFFKSLLAHGRFILRNLEIYETPQGKFTSNHYLANLVGLVYLGILFPEFNEAHYWRKLGLEELEKEIFRQVYPDGFNFESSTSYHRLSLEMFLSAVILATRNGISFSQSFMQRLEKMIEVVLHITKSDGTVPLIGDHDNGRLHRLKIWEESLKEWVDFRYLLAIGAVLFQRSDFALAAGDQWEEAIWLLGDEAIAFKEKITSDYPSSRNLISKHFHDAGIFVMRGKDAYLVIDAGRNGQNGIGGHAHNDLLSFEMFSHGHTWIIDPGTYVYTSNYADRRLFQSTAYHNTIRIDSEEINRFDPVTLFRLLDDALVRINHWITNDDYVLFDAEHSGYGRQKEPITIRRQILLDKQESYFLIRDQVIGRGVHQIESNFHLGSKEYQIQHLDPMTIQFIHPKGEALTILPLLQEGLELTLSEGWVSKTYGQRESAPVLTFTKTVKIPAECMFLFYNQSNIETVSMDNLQKVGEQLLSKLELFHITENH
jgi:uncharacterized heparinase superfamily protein